MHAKQERGHPREAMEREGSGSRKGDAGGMLQAYAYHPHRACRARSLQPLRIKDREAAPQIGEKGAQRVGGRGRGGVKWREVAGKCGEEKRGGGRCGEEREGKKGGKPEGGRCRVGKEGSTEEEGREKRRKWERGRMDELL